MTLFDYLGIDYIDNEEEINDICPFCQSPNIYSCPAKNTIYCDDCKEEIEQST